MKEPKTKKHRWIAEYHFKHRDKHGKIIDAWTEFNALADEGEFFVLDVALRGALKATNFYLGLVNDTPIETDALTDLTGEPSGNGYSRQTIESSNVGWPTLALDGGDYKATSKTVTFTASGGTIGPVTYAFLATSTDNTGKLMTYVVLSTPRTLADGESLECSQSVKLSEAA